MDNYQSLHRHLASVGAVSPLQLDSAEQGWEAVVSLRAYLAQFL
jgi:hypothetical protein